MGRQDLECGRYEFRQPRSALLVLTITNTMTWTVSTDSTVFTFQIRFIARIFTWKDTGLTFWTTAVIALLWIMEVVAPSQLMDDYLQVFFVMLIGPQNMLRGRKAGLKKAAVVLIVLCFDRTDTIPLGTLRDFPIWLFVAVLKVRSGGL